MQFNKFSSTRKANSASKVKEIPSFLSSDIHHARLSCTSASNYSGRNIRTLNQLKIDNFYETDEHFKQTENKNKLFLYASQVLGKMKEIKKSYDSHQLGGESSEKFLDLNISSCHLKLNARKVTFYHDLLKKLLEHRCILLLNEESQSCVKKTLKLVSDLKFFYRNEVVKLITMPIKSYNRFINSSDVSVTILLQLFQKVNFICDLHSSLNNNYQKIINFFHVGFDMELYQYFLKVNNFLNNQYSEMFYWTHKILEVFISKLCLADSNAVSPEFLHHIVEICGLFNSLFLNKKVKYIYFNFTCNTLLNSFIQFDYETILLDFILHYLSCFEAKVAAEKIIQFLILESKNRNFSGLKEKYESNGKPVIKSDTSDYFSASSTVIDDENPQGLMTENFSFSNIFHSLIQRNQSLVLKYLFSIICLDSTITCKCKKSCNETSGDSSTFIRSWNLSKNVCRNEIYPQLEEKYWKHFWQKVYEYTLELILEVPHHQYGNASIGVLLFWPHSYFLNVFNYLKLCANNADISFSGLDIMYKVYQTLLTQTMYESWDKKMSFALAITNGQPCVPIPGTSNIIRTRIGNSLCSCLQILIPNTLKHMCNLEDFQRLFNLFQVTLDYFVYLCDIKIRASISSYDISTYLFLSCSDCVHVTNLLEEKESFTAFFKSKYMKLFSCSKQNFIIKQIETLAGHVSESPSILYQIISYNVRKNTLYVLNKRCKDNIYHNNILHLSLIDLLDSFANISNHISDRIDILSTVGSALAHELLRILQLMHKKLSKKKVQVIKEKLHDFFNWLEEQNIEPAKREKLKDMNCFKKLFSILQILELYSSNQRYYLKRRNKIKPLGEVCDKFVTILTEEEQLYWQLGIRQNYFLCC